MTKVKLLARIYIHVAQVVPLYNYAAKLEQYMWGWIKIINHAQYDKKLYMSYLYVECRVENHVSELHAHFLELALNNINSAPVTMINSHLYKLQFIPFVYPYH